MSLDFSSLNWIAILIAVIAGQALLTLWFAALFAAPWARAYGTATAKEHTAAIPPWTYGVGLVCTALVTVAVALLQAALGIAGVAAALGLGLFLAVLLAVPAILPGYAFLGRLQGGAIAAGSQAAMILLVSVVLALF